MISRIALTNRTGLEGGLDPKLAHRVVVPVLAVVPVFQCATGGEDRLDPVG